MYLCIAPLSEQVLLPGDTALYKCFLLLLFTATLPHRYHQHSSSTSIGVRGNIHLGGQTEFCLNGNLFVTRPRQGEKIIMNYCSAYF